MARRHRTPPLEDCCRRPVLAACLACWLAPVGPLVLTEPLVLAELLVLTDSLVSTDSVVLQERLVRRLRFPVEAGPARFRGSSRAAAGGPRLEGSCPA